MCYCGGVRFYPGFIWGRGFYRLFLRNKDNQKDNRALHLARYSRKGYLGPGFAVRGGPKGPLTWEDLGSETMLSR